MTKEELLQYRVTKKEIVQLKERIEMLKDKKTSIKSQIISDMPLGGNSVDTEAIMVMIENSIEEWIKKEELLIDLMFEIEECIDGLDDSTERYIMRARYIECKTFEQIAVDIDRSWRHTVRKHGEILEKIR